MRFGIYRQDGLWDESSLSAIEEELNTPISFLSFFRAWNHCTIEEDVAWLDAVLSSQRDILITWEPWRIPADADAPQNQPEFSLQKILAGIYDPYIRAFASRLQDYSRTVYLRPMHEMNGFWYPWCGTVNGNSPQEFNQVWRHLRTLFAQEGSHNVKWVWSPYATSYPTDAVNGIETYFPGDRAIDLTALDGYNWGTATEWGNWQEFVDVFGKGYDTVLKFSAKPLIIGETGCSELGGNKTEWILKMFHQLQTRFNRIEALIWFDVDKECDWRVSSSPRALSAFRENSGKIFEART